MNSEAENIVRINQLKFIGKIVSIFAHDMNNQLGTIKEVSGLMEDIIELHKSTDNLLKGELAKPLNSIYNRVGNAAFITNKLSEFGRGMDRGASSININETVGELLVLSRRLAAQRRIELVSDFRADSPSVNADPLMLQFLMFCLMEDQLMKLKAKGRLVFRTDRSKEAISVMILSEGEEEQSDEKRTFPIGMAQLIADTYGFKLTANDRDSRIILNL